MSRPRPILWLRAHQRAADWILAVVITTVALVFHVLQLDQTEDYRDPSWWTSLFIVASILPIAWRRSFPLRSGLFVAAAQILTALLDIDGTGFLGVLIALYSIGAHSSGQRRTNVVWTIAVGMLLLFTAGLSVGEVGIGDFISSTVVLVTAYILGDNLRRRRERADSLAERAERAEREQALIAQQQVNAERTRIARELHDVVAHSVSVMVIQAAAARRNLADAPEVADVALGNIEATGRQTMNELRGILGVLRREVDDGVALAPQPVLTEVEALVEASDDLPISLTIDGDLDDLTQSVTLTGYRIVQEALTNVRRHAGKVDHVELTIVRTDDTVDITVVDDGRGAAADDIGQGYGVVGMRERVAAVNGSVTAGPQHGGGWRVHVRLPVQFDAAEDDADGVTGSAGSVTVSR